MVRYLFGGYNPTYSHKLIYVERFEAKSEITYKIPYEKVSLLYSGLAKLKMRKRGLVYETQLVHGAMLTNPLYDEEKDSEKDRLKTIKQQLICLSDCLILSLDYQEFKKIIKNEKGIKNSIRLKKRDVEVARQRLLNCTRNAQQFLKGNQESRPIMHYPIKMHKRKSKIFRQKTKELKDIETFMSVDFYAKMIANKESVVHRKDECELKQILLAHFLQPESRSASTPKTEIKDDDVTLQGFFEVGSRIKTKKLSQSILKKEMPGVTKKQPTDTNINETVKKDSLFKKMMPKSARRNQQHHIEMGETEKDIRRSENIAFGFNSFSFEPDDRISCKLEESRKRKADTFFSTNSTDKTATSDFKFIRVDTKNIINVLCQQKPSFDGRQIPPRSAPLKKRKRNFMR